MAYWLISFILISSSRIGSPFTSTFITANYSNINLKGIWADFFGLFFGFGSIAVPTGTFFKIGSEGLLAMRIAESRGRMAIRFN